MSGSATKGNLGKSVFGHNENGGREAISGGGKLQQDRFTSSILQKQRRCQGQALRSDACMFHIVLQSVARLPISAVLPHDVEAVLCKLYSHHTYAAVHTKISTNTPTKVLSLCRSFGRPTIASVEQGGSFRLSILKTELHCHFSG